MSRATLMSSGQLHFSLQFIHDFRHSSSDVLCLPRFIPCSLASYSFDSILKFAAMHVHVQECICPTALWLAVCYSRERQGARQGDRETREQGSEITRDSICCVVESSTSLVLGGVIHFWTTHDGVMVASLESCWRVHGRAMRNSRIIDHPLSLSCFYLSLCAVSRMLSPLRF